MNFLCIVTTRREAHEIGKFGNVGKTKLYFTYGNWSKEKAELLTIIIWQVGGSTDYERLPVYDNDYVNNEWKTTRSKLLRNENIQKEIVNTSLIHVGRLLKHFWWKWEWTKDTQCFYNQLVSHIFNASQCSLVY